MNWKDIKNLIKEELTEATTVNAGNTKFNLRTGVNKNPTKLGLKIQFEPLSGELDKEVKSKLEVALQEKLNTSLAEYNLRMAGTGGSSLPDLKQEFSDTPHERGTLSMARS